MCANQKTPAGTQAKAFKSETFKGQEVSYLFWAPPGYDSTDRKKRYPVALFLHGGGGNYTHIPETFLPQAEQAIKDDKLSPFIAIAVNGLASSFYTDSKDGKTPVESVIIKDLLADVDAEYPTNGVRLLEGFSMGGRGATYFAFKYPNKFQGVADFSGAIHGWEFFGTFTAVASLYADQKSFEESWPFNLASRNAETIRNNMKAGVFICVGDADTGRGNTYQWNVKLKDKLDELKIAPVLNVVKGVRHSYQLLAKDETVTKKHLEYYAKVFRLP